MSHIFISYARKDINFAGKIVRALAKNKLDTWIDWKSIPKGEDWEQEIYRGIEGADAFLFLISPYSVVSQMCNKEIAHAVKNGKRILPIFISNANIDEVHRGFYTENARAEIARRNYIFCRDGLDDFDKAIEETRKTIHTDYEWLKYHTELLVKALKWDQKKDNSRLLRGRELREAEQQFANSERNDPQPTYLQRQFVLASQRNEIRIRRQITIGLSLGLVVMAIISIFAWIQRNEAQRQARIALANGLAAQSQAALEQHPQRSLLLAMEALKVVQIPFAEETLFQNLTQINGIGIGSHADIVNDVAISASNHWAVSCSADGSLYLWNLTDSESLSKPIALKSQDSPLLAVVISSDDRWIAAGSASGDIYLWDIATLNSSKEPVVLLGHKDAVTAIAISADSHWLVTGSQDYTARLWDLNNLKIAPIVLSSQSGSVTAVAISSTNHWIITGSKDGTIRVWDLSAPNPAAGSVVLKDHDDAITAVVVSHDNHWLITGSADKTTRLWTLDDLDSGSIVLRGPEKSVTAISVSSDNHWLAIGSNDGAVYLWNLSNLNDAPVILRDHDGPVDNVAITSDGRWLLASGDDNVIYMWSLVASNPALSPTVLRGHDGSITIMAVSPDSRWLVTGSVDKAVRLWDLTDSTESAFAYVALRGHTKGIISAGISADSRYLATVAADNTLRLWDLKTPDAVPPPLVIHIPYENVTISSDDRWLVAGRASNGKNDEFFDLWDISTLTAFSKPVKSDYGKFAISPNGHWLVTSVISTTPAVDQVPESSTYGTTQLYDLTNLDGEGISLPVPGEKYDVECRTCSHTTTFSPDNHWLFTSNDFASYLWDLTSQDPTATPMSLPDEFIGIDSAVISTDGHWLVGIKNTFGFFGSLSDSAVMLWNFRDLTTAPRTLKCQDKSTTPLFIISPDSRWVVIGTDDGSICQWNLSNLSANPLVLSEHSGAITAIAVDPASQKIVSGSEDGTIRRWNLGSSTSSLSVFRDHVGAISSIFITTNGRWLISTSKEDNAVRLRSFSRDSSIFNASEIACRIAGRNLTSAEWEQYLSGTAYHATCEQWPSDNNILSTSNLPPVPEISWSPNARIFFLAMLGGVLFLAWILSSQSLKDK